MIQLGIDPSSQPGAHHAALYDGTRCIAAGVLAMFEYEVRSGCIWLTLEKSESACAIHPKAVIIETPDVARGTYLPAAQLAKAASPAAALAMTRSRNAAVSKTYQQACDLARQFHEAGCAVYTPSREVILQQAGYNARRDGKAEQWVMLTLALRGQVKFPDLPSSDGKLRVCEPAYLRNEHNRDACMASLFFCGGTNEQYRYKRA